MEQPVAKTLISSDTAFATAAQLVLFRDWRHLADLVNDDDTRAANSAAVQAHAVTVQALRSASGQIEAAIYRGGRYTREDIDVILDSVDSPLAKDYLAELACNLAYWIMLKRRKPDLSPRAVSGVPEALKALIDLELGEAVLPFQEVVDASVMDYTPLDPNRGRASVNAEPLSSQAGRMFGTRSRQM